jgi:HSP20 family protein
MARSFLQLVEALERLQGESAAQCMWRPAADVYRTREGWLVKFDLAGVNPNEVQLVLEGRRLTISGVRHDALMQECCATYSLEISYHRFQRTLELPCDTEAAAARTEYRDGMLLVWLQET